MNRLTGLLDMTLTVEWAVKLQLKTNIDNHIYLKYWDTLTLCMLGKNFCRQHFEIFFLIFLRK